MHNTHAYSADLAALTQKRLRILFYLPVVTPWWFENIVVHLIRKLASAYEVHVMVPPLWRNTGLPKECTLAVTNHPLTELHGDTREVQIAVAELSGKAVLLDQSGEPGDTTLALVQNCDGMIVGNSKVWAACAALGRHMLRRSVFATGNWVKAYKELRPFLDALTAGVAAKADPMLARRWFTFHLANNVFDPAASERSSADIIDRIVRPFSPERWSEGMERYRSQAGSFVRKAV